MYATLKREALRKRKKAVKTGIPTPFLWLADSHINRAIFIRTRPETKTNFNCRFFNRSKSELLIAIEIFDAHLDNRFSLLSNPLLMAEVVQ